MGMLSAAAATAILSVPAAAQQPVPTGVKGPVPSGAEGLTIAGKWDVQAGQANYTLEFGFPEQHAKLLGTPSSQHSVIVDPPDGRIPFQPWAMTIRNARDKLHEDPAHMRSRDLDSQAKCYPTGVPRFANRGGPLITVFPDKVLMQIEYGHEYRIIYTDGRPRLPRQVKLWNGDARGHWEGATFVVETTTVFQRKLELMRIHRSQFEKTAEEFGVIAHGVGDYLFGLESRDRYFGSLIGARHGEALVSERPLRLSGLNHVLSLLGR
jgi:hypothetical protein